MTKTEIEAAWGGIDRMVNTRGLSPAERRERRLNLRDATEAGDGMDRTKNHQLGCACSIGCIIKLEIACAEAGIEIEEDQT